ncbi:unnamed protein product [Adineta ricciae]|uniref:Uncharacterized protein n=1 Tax=Adineta ricciae TaxID=249248 RepID=A0A815FY17_ADIRI|nr:unnamed protein product [Adineta ricciae]
MYFFTILIDCSLLDAFHTVLLFQLFKQTYEHEQQQQSPRPPPSNNHSPTTGKPAEFVFDSHTIDRHAGRSFRRLDPLKSESVPAGSLPPDSGRNCTGNIRSVPDRF